jgi:hypothetical protein
MIISKRPEKIIKEGAYYECAQDSGEVEAYFYVVKVNRDTDKQIQATVFLTTDTHQNLGLTDVTILLPVKGETYTQLTPSGFLTELKYENN